MKTIAFWIALVLVLALSVALFLRGGERATTREISRIDELEREQNGRYSTRMRLMIARLPREQLKDTILKEVAALRDSAHVLRSDAIDNLGGVSPALEEQIDHIRRHARELEVLAGRLSDADPIDVGRLDLYKAMVMTYGAGGYMATQMRREVGLRRER